MKYPKKKWKNGRRKSKYSYKSTKKRLTISWSREVKATTGGLCALCGSDYKVQSHHIIKKGISYHSGWFLLINGIPLCWNCHHDGIHSMHFPTQQEYHKKIEAYLKRKGLTYEKLYNLCKGSNGKGSVGQFKARQYNLQKEKLDSA